MSGRPQQFFRLARVNPLAGPAEGVAPAVSHFDENQCRGIAQHQIDFAKTAAVVALQNIETALYQESCSDIFGPGPAIAHRIGGASSGLALPWEKCAGTSERVNCWVSVGVIVPVTPSSETIGWDGRNNSFTIPNASIPSPSNRSRSTG